jgi:hypothetical protein
MIRELMIGTALIGGGGYYFMTHTASAGIVRTVNATPQDTWRAFDLVLNQYSQQMAEISQGDAKFPDGTALSPPIVTSVPAKEIDFRLNKGGVEAIHVHVGFASLGEGHKTQMTMQVDVNTGLGGNAPRLGGTIGFKRALNELADALIPQIESGKLLQAGEAFADMRRKMVANPHAGEMRMHEEEYARREAQAAAAKPMLDPNKAALDPKGASAAPMSGDTRY